MYVLEELLLADSLEKIIRMEVYFNDAEVQASEDEIKIVTFYKNIIKTIKNQLENSAESLKAYHGTEINKEISTTCIKNCLNVSLGIRDIHNEFLSYLPSLKTRAETYTFLKNLLQQITEIETESIKPAIVLFDTYTYEERNISQSLKEICFVLHPGEFALGSTLEFIRLPDDIAARLEGRSTWGRVGLQIHSTAGFVDPGFSGSLTFELQNMGKVPLSLYAGMRVAQISFYSSEKSRIPYDKKRFSKYGGKMGTVGSKYSEDPEFEMFRKLKDLEMKKE